MEKTICPDCKNEILTDPEYPVWCQNCNWSLKFEDKVVPKTKLEKFYKNISDKHSKSLFERIKNNEIELSLKVKPLRTLAYIISIMIISLNVSLLFIGIYLVFQWKDNIQIILGFIFLGLFWLSKPKFRKLPKDKFASKVQTNELYKLVNLVCEKLGTSPVEGIIVDYEFNASITEIGLAKKKVLRIGLPLWTILTNEEKLALLGHEISHCVNKDPTRSIIISKGINILIDTAYAIYPPTLVPDMFSTSGGIETIVIELAKYLVVPLNLVIRLFAHILWYCADLLSQIMWVDSQRAEYLADLSGSKISGNESAISLMNKLSFYDVFHFEIRKLALKQPKEINSLDLFEILKNKVDSLPEHEKERLKRIQDFEEHRIDSTHPPTYFRKLMLKDKGSVNSEDIINQINFELIDEELKIFRPKHQEKLVDLYKTYINRPRSIQFK